MAIGKGLNAFLAAYYKAKESASKETYQQIQLAYLMNKLGGGIPKGADSDQARAEKGYKPVPYGGLREGRSSAPAPIGGFDNAVNRTIGFEGTGEATRDNNGGLVKYGINSLANPGVDVANLTEDQARAIYKTKYWDSINGDELAKANPALAHVAFDTAVNAGPDKAREFLSAANGDPYKFLQLRQAHQDSLTASGDTKYGGNIPQAWADRNASLRADLDAHIRPQGVPTTAVAQSALPDITTRGVATPALTAATTPPARSDNLGQALPVEAGVTSPTPMAYAPEVYPQAIPVDYASYDPYNTEAVYAAKGGLVPDLRQRWVQHFQGGGEVEPDTGLLEPGNIDLNTRPVVRNPDGTISTVRSMGVNIDGQEVLLPTVSDDGRIMSDDAAVQQYMQTGRHLGKFRTPAASNAYAQRLHEMQAQQYGRGYARGGFVQHFQGGGDVLPDPDPYGADDINPTNYQALYSGAGDMGGIPTSAQPAQPVRQINNPISALLDTASDAVTAGVKWLHDKFDVANATLSGIGEHAGLRGLANHEGAAPAGDVQETEDAVDPEKHMNAGARRLAGMNAAYQYYLAHGEETKAKAVAGSMLMYSKQVAAESADMALRAPNYIAGAKILAQGHNQMPGAPQFQIDDNGNYVARDPKTGKPIDAGVMSPQQVLAAARGMKDGSVFWRTLQTYTKPDEDEETLPEKKDRLRREAIGGALKTLGLPGATSSGAAPPTAGAIPTAPPPAGTTAADDEGDTSDEGRSAGTAATPTAPVEAPASVTSPAAPLPKAGMKPAVAAAYTGVPLNFVDTLDTPEKKKAYEDIITADPRMATEYQKAHERRLAQAAEAAQRTAAANAPAPPPKEAALNQGTIAKDVDTASDAHNATLTEQKQPIPPPSVIEQTKFLARNIAKHDPERRSGADGFDAATELLKAPFGMAGDKIPTSKDGKGADYKEAMRMLPYDIKKDKDGPYVVSKEDGTTIRMSQEGRLRLEKLLRDRAAKQWEVQNEKKPSTYDFIPGWRKFDDASVALADRLKRGVSDTAGDVTQGAKDFGTAWMQRTAPEFQGAANAVAAVPGMIPQNLPGIPQLVQQGIPNVPPGRLPQQVITAGAMNRQPTMVPVAPGSLPQPSVGLRDMPWYPIATGPSRQGIPTIPRNVPMPDWTLYPNDNP